MAKKTGNFSYSIEHIVIAGRNTLYYPSGDDHPNVAGSKKAKTEFVPLLNIFYNRWKAEDICQKAVFSSNAAQDGWILESAENSSTGGTLNSTATTFNLGDNAARKQYRAILSFDTSSLPDNAVVTRVALKIKRQGLVGTNPFNILGGLLVDMQKPFFGTTVELMIRDFQAAAGKSSVATFGVTPADNWFTALLNDTGKAFLNRTRTTQFRLRFAIDDNNNNVADYMQFFSGNYATGANRPKIFVEYYVP